ncbi:MAG: SPOR domain-containing protein [Planctomycetota bacterium]|jgi:hypothetical protein
MAIPVRWRRQMAALTVAGAIGACVLGVLFFVLAFSPCRLSLEPGATVSYTLATSVFDATSGAQVGARESRVEMVCVGSDNEVALVTPGGDGRREELTMLQFDRSGRVRRFDPGLRLLDEGKALGFFDFNLLPLPVGLDQDWRVELTYAVPPPGRRQVSARVRRVSNGFNPEFELTLPVIEWVEQQPQPHWLQIRDLTCRYRYDGRLGLVDHAELRFSLGVEQAGGARFHRVHIDLDAELRAPVGEVRLAALSDLAFTAYGAQTLLEDGRRSELSPLVTRLRQASVDAPADLRALALRLAAAADGAVAATADGAWVVQLATVAPARRTQAEALVADLVADGWPAYVDEAAGHLRVRVGPYAERHAEVLEQLAGWVPHDRPLWQQR